MLLMLLLEIIELFSKAFKTLDRKMTGRRATVLNRRGGIWN